MAGLVRSVGEKLLRRRSSARRFSLDEAQAALMKLEGPKREEVVRMMRDWEATLDDHILANIRNIHALRTHQAGFFNCVLNRLGVPKGGLRDMWLWRASLTAMFFTSYVLGYCSTHHIINNYEQDHEA
ncbi:uncharacterized protein LOC127779003 [Oryza glaberrima]|uniref:uncharacterized protein LOC127779003 n=1 Tax=Oryza glaberrima TaxID=4538 RepID=UPI00224C3FC2|nr:uncharacterized protein LOC127779003 [Oryza glaberrima]